MRSLGVVTVLVLWAGVLPAAAKSVHVVIDDLSFSPGIVTARIGDTIVWINKDAVAHTATASDAFDVQIAPGKSAGVVVRKAGSFQYICRFHPNMTGQVVVAPR